MIPTHAMQRALERCPGVCPGVLIRQVKHAVLNKYEGLVRFVARIRRENFKALYFFRLPNGLPRYVLVIIPTGYIVTFLEPGSTIWTNRGQFWLGENGLEALTDDHPQELCGDL